MAALLSICLLLPSGCAIRIAIESQPDAFKAAPSTFLLEPARAQEESETAWTDAFDPAVISLLDSSLRNAISARGYRDAATSGAAADPDLRIQYRVSRGEQIRETSIPGHVRWMRVDIREIEYQTYIHGTLVVDVIDPAQNLLLWHGVAKSVLEAPVAPEERDKRIKKAVTRLIRQLPAVDLEDSPIR